MNGIDLHIHSTFSDGTESPAAIIKLASQAGLKAIALTDHDTTAGINEALAHGEQHGVEVLSGVEISASLNGHPMHILGYDFDHDDPLFQKRLKRLQDARHQRNLKIFERLKTLGLPLDITEIPPTPGQVGRPHIARLLIEKNIVKNMDQAFRKFLRRGSAAYVQCFRMEAGDAVGMIREAGGVAFLAHPAATDRHLQTTPRLLADLHELGLSGLELYYPTHHPKTVAKLRRLGEKLGLIFSGGSDFHGDGKPYLRLGSYPDGQAATYELVRGIRRAAQAVRQEKQSP